ncbi:hypothetical protein [Leifsonia xyli]|uniref:hypothetical protein n=1 Tax=Leifsonia xyli TaxID=1575 RepID=UPI0021093F6E|nr:hypothetical protein [Leifsonia xyli]
MTEIPAAHRQSKYHVRFDWGEDGLAAVDADADVVVWVDALETPAAASAAQAPVARPLAGHPLTVAASLADALAVARSVLDEQVRLGRRCLVAVFAAGAGTPSGAPRFAVEDLLAAGAVVDALAALGIDDSSPEAAAA